MEDSVGADVSFGGPGIAEMATFEPVDGLMGKVDPSHPSLVPSLQPPLGGRGDSATSSFPYHLEMKGKIL